MNNPVLLQKQIKDNNEDLLNFVRDLKHWETEMKRKDTHLSKDQSEEVLPPVRRPKLPKKAPVEKKLKEKDKKRIPSYDYKSWDNFNVEKACEEIDKVNTGDEKEEETDEDCNVSEETILMEKALYEKELGNRHVKAANWDKAIESYTRAITSYPKDPIFFANRALCYLKNKQFGLVEEDCTKSLKLDPTYVKALMRRAAAREALGRLEDARHDLSEVLLLEPNNVQAQKDLNRVKVAKVDKTKIGVKEPIKKEENRLSTSAPMSKIETPLPLYKYVTEAKNSTKNGISESTNIDEPNWKPADNTVEPVVKPPHLRSKKSLKRITIHDIGLNATNHECPKKSSQPKGSSLITHTLPDETLPLPETANESKEKASGSIKKVENETKLPCGPKHKSVLTLNTPVLAKEQVPPPPKTSVQFYTSWSCIKADRKLCYQFLKQIPGEDLPEIFKESLESKMFTSIVDILASVFIEEGESVLPYLRGLSGVRRFSTIVLFMSSSDKTNVLKLLNYCLTKGECLQSVADELHKLYEVF